MISCGSMKYGKDGFVRVEREELYESKSLGIIYYFSDLNNEIFNKERVNVVAALHISSQSIKLYC